MVNTSDINNDNVITETTNEITSTDTNTNNDNHHNTANNATLSVNQSEVQRQNVTTNRARRAQA